MDDLDSAFEGIVFAENQCQQEGYDVGFKQGEIQGYLDGYSAGQKQAGKLASELGFYEGFASSWLKLLDEKDEKNRRKMKALTSLMEVIASVPLSDATDPKLHDKVDVVRSKFKQVCSVLNVKTSYTEKKDAMSF